ncbi:MAG: bifunctional oligoribonuclease/PAP phosphatase NrnA [Dysgonamonadaceae bacterium]|jgi:phosphoesterase RecJ-like protein|nr:bifunctional oligoribonuclease/PAP phosphatase NrnA [Dysgonamonadaceae bacterium]
MLNKIISEENIQKAKKLALHYDKIVIVTHQAPDGDALGSSLGLYHFLKQFGKKEVQVIVPNDYPAFLHWMPGTKSVINAEWQGRNAEFAIASADLIFCLDFNTLKRISQLENPVRQSKAKKILIDHHLSPEDFCDVTISHPEISSTSELVFRFICRMGMFEYVNEPCAECIYTGMMTDTGAFTYNSSSYAIYYIISELLQKGIDKDAIYSRVYNQCKEGRVRMQGYVLYEKMKIFDEYKTSLITLSEEEHLRFNPERGDTEGFVNIPLSMEKIVFSAFIREDKGIIRISLRSKGTFPTNRFAAEVYDGGGHLNASGGEFLGTLAEAVRKFEEALPGYRDLLE